MYNTDLPRRADLPTSAQLRRSTWIAMISASFILVTVVLPSEYAIDPTGIGRMLGLTQMGAIKTQLAAEAATDAAASGQSDAGLPPAALPGYEQVSARLDRIEAMIARLNVQAPADQAAPGSVEQGVEQQEAVAELPAEASSARFGEVEETGAVPEVEPEQVAADSGRSDEVSFTLPPGEGAEVKLVMAEGALANFSWTANGSVVNFDTHGDGGGNSISYEKGRGVAEDEGVLKAAFEGNHGWFWRNRTGADVTVTLRTSGDYSDIKRMR